MIWNLIFFLPQMKKFHIPISISISTHKPLKISHLKLSNLVGWQKSIPCSNLVGLIVSASCWWSQQRERDWFLAARDEIKRRGGVERETALSFYVFSLVNCQFWCWVEDLGLNSEIFVCLVVCNLSSWQITLSYWWWWTLQGSLSFRLLLPSTINN